MRSGDTSRDKNTTHFFRRGVVIKLLVPSIQVIISPSILLVDTLMSVGLVALRNY